MCVCVCMCIRVGHKTPVKKIITIIFVVRFDDFFLWALIWLVPAVQKYKNFQFLHIWRK